MRVLLLNPVPDVCNVNARGVPSADSISETNVIPIALAGRVDIRKEFYRA